MVRSSAVRSIARRAAALAATGTLTVLATAGPALAQSAPAPRPHTAAVSVTGAGSAQDAQPALLAQQANAPVQTTDTPPPCEHEHHGGLLSSLLEGTGILLGKLLGVLL